MKLPALLHFEQKDSRYPFLFLFLTALAALGMAIYFYLVGADQAVPWEKIADLQQVNFPANRFELLLQPLEVRVRGFLVTERFDVGLPVIHTQLAVGLLAFLSIAAVYYLAVVSLLPQLPFFAAMLLWMLFLTTFNFDLLGIFPGTRQYILLGTLLATGGLAFVFQAFLTHVRLPWRVLTFALLFAGLGLFLWQASPLSAGLTALHLSNYGALGCLAAAAIFIFWVAYENIHGLLWFNTQARKPERRFSRWQFILISCLYLTNLVLLYLRNTRIFPMDILLLNEFLILLSSALVGFWGTRQREKLYGRFLSFGQGAALLYLAFGIITAASIGYAFATANDPLLRAFADLIVFSHLAFGAAFLLYLLINFGGLIAQRLRVYKVVYDPKNFPFLMMVLAGAVLFTALLLRAHLVLPRKAMAGYYNYLGDFYKKSGDNLLAERFHTESNGYYDNNFKAIYSLAAIYNEKLYYQTEIKTLKKGTESHPSDKLFVRLANKYPDRSQLFEQLFLLQQGVKQFPKSAPLLNNLALLYGTTSMEDSAAYYFERAQQHISQPETVYSNRLAFYILTGQGKQAAEMARSMGEHTYLPLQNNLLVLQSFRQDKWLKNPVALPEKKPLTPAEFALVYQSGMQGQTLSDKATLQRIGQYLKEDANEPYRFDLSLTKAFVQQRLGQALAARTTLENLAGTEADYAGYLQDLIGLQLMQQKLYKAAAAHFYTARTKGWPEAGLHFLLALAMQHDQVTEALLEAEKLQAGENPAHKAIARQLLFLLQAKPVQVITQASDSLKVQYLQLNQHPDLLTDQEFLAITSTVKDPNLKLLAEKELATFHVSRDEFTAAARVIEAMLPNLSSEGQILSEVNLLQAEILLRSGKDQDLKQALDQMYLTDQDKPKKHYYLAQLAERSNQLKEAQRHYNLALQAMPAHAPSVLAAAAFYQHKLRNGNKAYDLLLNSIIYNPFDAEVYKAYILQSVEVGYGSFAESALQDLAKLLPPAQLAAFQQQYKQQVAKRRAAF